MTPRERILRSRDLAPVDRPPILGGWITSAAHLQALCEITPEEYWADPTEATIEAYRRLGVDGLISFFLPPSQDRYRGISHETLEERARNFPTPEHVREYVENLPDPDTLEGRFDVAAFAQEQVEARRDFQRRLGDIVWMPAQWDSCANFMWYGSFGYESYLAFLALYPDLARKLFEVAGEEARLRNLGYLRVYAEEGGDPPPLLLGQDICGARGPLCSVKFLEEVYFPQALRSLTPLHAAGVQTIWHSDGDIRPILDHVIDLGVAGFQGFQEEHGVRLADLMPRRMQSGRRPLIFGNLSVTVTLPHGTVEDVKRAVDRSVELAGPSGLFFCTSNTIGPEVPLANLLAMYEQARQVR